MRITRQVPLNADIDLEIGDQPPSAVWRDLAGDRGFRVALVDALVDLCAASETITGLYRTLEDGGVTALDGSYADLCVAFAAHGGEGDQRNEALSTLIDVTMDFGQPNSRSSVLGIGMKTALLAVTDGPLALLGLADTSPPTVAVELGTPFLARKLEHRRTICRLIGQLAQVCDVRIVTKPSVERRLRRDHTEDLPGVSRTRSDSLSRGALEALVETADLTLERDGRAESVLRSIADEPAETCSYRRLVAKECVTRSRIRQVISHGETSLTELQLVEAFNGTEGTTASLLPAGRRLIKRLDAEYGRQAHLFDTVRRSVRDPPNPSNHGRVGPPVGIGEGGQPGGTSPSAAEAEGSSGSRPTADRWSQGHVAVRELSRREYAAAVAGAEPGGIGLVDHPIAHNRVGDVREGRQGMWFYDPDADRLVVGAEYYNPLQYQVAVARALADPRTFRHVLTLDRLEEVFDTPVSVLRHARNLGYLSDRATNSEDYRKELERAREDLLDLTHDLKQAETNDSEKYLRLRSTILSFAHGLAGVVVHILNLLDVDIVRELRLPQFNRKHLSDSKFRSSLARTLSHTAAIQSKYGSFVAYRQLFESRSDRRQSSFSPVVDTAAPFGSLIGSFAIVGPGVTDLESELRQSIRHPAELHEDAPEFAIPIKIADRTHSRSGFASAVRTMCNGKSLDPSRQAITLLRAFCGTPYDSAVALAGLARETKAPGREIHPDEVRFALATLPPDRVLPTLAPSVSKLIHALIDTCQPLSQRSLADRAGISTQSIRNHREHLVAIGLLVIEGTDTPGTAHRYRLALPFRSERDPHGDTDAEHLPWYAVGSSDRHCSTSERDVLFEIAAAVTDPSRLADLHDPIGGPLFGNAGRNLGDAITRPDALPWLPIIDTLLDSDGYDETELDSPRPPNETPSSPEIGYPADKDHSDIEIMGSRPVQQAVTEPLTV